MTKERLENIKLYSFVIGLFDGFIMILAGVDTYETFMSGEISDASKWMFVFTLSLLFILIMVYFIVRYRLKKIEGENYTGISDVIKLCMEALILTSRTEKKEIEQFGSNAKHSLLWKHFGQGINKGKSISFCLLTVVGIYLLYHAYDIYISKNPAFFNEMFGKRFLGDTNEYMSSALSVFVMALIVFANALVAFLGVRKNGTKILEFVNEKKVSFEDLNKEFAASIKAGKYIWIGENYFFTQTKGVGRVFDLEEVLACTIHRMGGIHPSRLFIPYYVFEIQMKEEDIYIRGLRKHSFQKAQTLLEKRTIKERI